MITNNFKNYCAAMLMAAPYGTDAQNTGLVPARSIGGSNYYLTPFNSNGYPSKVGLDVQFDPADSEACGGFLLSDSSTPSTGSDYTMGHFAGCNGTATIHETGVDEYGNPYITFDLAVSADTDPVSVWSIGFAQRIGCVVLIGGASAGLNAPFLLDRTVLSTPISLISSEYTTIRYTLKTIIGE